MITASTPISVEGGQRLDQLGQLVLADQRVDGDEHAPRAASGEWA